MKHNRTAIVTGGAGGGIGHGISTVLAENDWNVVVVDLDEQEGHRCVDGLQQAGHAAALFHADISDPGTAAAAVEFALRQFGYVRGLVNSAGIGLVKPIGEVGDAEFSRLWGVDFEATYRFCRAAVGHLGPRGAIVNVGSVHARASVAGYSAYAAAKAAVEGLTRALAVELGPARIRVNCIHPGFVMSPQNRDLIARLDPDVDGWVDHFVKHRQALPDPVTPRDVGELAAFLLSDSAAGITGQAIAIDGGTTAMLFERTS